MGCSRLGAWLGRLRGRTSGISCGPWLRLRGKAFWGNGVSSDGGRGFWVRKGGLGHFVLRHRRRGAPWHK